MKRLTVFKMGNLCGRAAKLDAATAAMGGAGNWAQPSHNAPPGSPPSGPAQAFLQGMGLGIYVQAFQLAGFDDEKQLQALTHQDLARIERETHIPILPAHQQKILQAACCYSANVMQEASGSLCNQASREDDVSEQLSCRHPAGGTAQPGGIAQHSSALMSGVAAGGACAIVHVNRSRPATPSQPGDLAQPAAVQPLTRQHSALQSREQSSTWTVLACPSAEPVNPRPPSSACASTSGDIAAAAAAAGATFTTGLSQSNSLVSVNGVPTSSSSASAAAGPSPAPATPATGPLMSNRTALAGAKSTSRGCSTVRPPPLPPAAQARRPTAWTEVANEVAGLSLGATASLAGSGGGCRQVMLPGTSGSAGLLQTGALLKHAPALTPRQLTPRQSDPGPQQQQRQGEWPVAGSCGGATAAVASCSFTAAAAAGQQAQLPGLADLPPSVQQLHEKMLARLRAQENSSSKTSSLPVPAFSHSAEPSSCQLQPVPEHSGRLAWPAEQQRSSDSRQAAILSRPCSAAGSCVSGGACCCDYRPSSSASTRAGGTAARAADVHSIVHQARERAAARHRLPETMSGLQAEQSRAGSSCSFRAPAAQLGGGSSRSSSMLPQQEQQRAAAAGQLQAEPSLVADQSHSLLAESSIAKAGVDVTVSAAFRDGERKMRMLQEYRVIGELDAAIQARVQQLSHQAAAPAAPPPSAGSYAVFRATDNSAAASWRPGMAPARADTAKKAADWRQHETQQQLEPLPSSSPLLKKRPAAAAGGGAAAGGLLGIREALNNSYDCGQIQRGRSGSGRVGAADRIAAAARQAASASLSKPPPQQQPDGGGSSSTARSRLASGRSGIQNRCSSRPGSSSSSTRAEPGVCDGAAAGAAAAGSRSSERWSHHMAAALGAAGVSSAAAVDSYYNPFVSPESSPVKTAPAGGKAGGETDTNPFLRESLVLQPMQGLVFGRS